MLRKLYLSLAVALVTLLAAQGTLSASTRTRLVRYNGGFFTIEIPRGWRIYTAGSCAEFAFVVRDPRQPLRQIFFFGAVGPVYLSAQQKQIDINYMRMGGYPIPYVEAPVVSPFTPVNFMAHFQYIASTTPARRFMPQAPRLYRFTPISAQEVQPMIYGGRTSLIRALFLRGRRVGEGLFLCSVAPFMPFTGGPGGGTGYGFLVSGVTAPQKEFPSLLPLLTRSLASFTLSRGYVQQCLQASRATFAQILRAGQTLRETSDLIYRGWANRNRRYDIMAEKRSDAILGYDRVYDPHTGETYQVDPSFWEHYRSHREDYQMRDLQPLPQDNYNLWTKVPKPQREIR